MKQIVAAASDQANTVSCFIIVVVLACANKAKGLLSNCCTPPFAAVCKCKVIICSYINMCVVSFVLILLLTQVP